MRLRRGRREAQARHRALVDDLLARPEEWERLEPLIAQAADAAGLRGDERDQLHALVVFAEWDQAMGDGVLREKDEERPAKIGAGLSLPRDVLSWDAQRRERAVVARSNAGRFPTPVARPRLASTAAEIVHLEVPAKLTARRTVRTMKGSGVGVSVPLGHGLNYVIALADAKETHARGEVVDDGVLSVSDQRVVFIGARHSVHITYGQLLDLRVLPHSLSFAQAGVAERHEIIVPFLHGVAAVINLQVNTLRGHLPDAAA